MPPSISAGACSWLAQHSADEIEADIRQRPIERRLSI
jgi:hypothetical protein